MTVALICGVSGQDGGYLARLLLDKGYRVIGTTRSLADVDRWRLDRLGVTDDVELAELDLTDSVAVAELIGARSPGEIYNLAGQSSVGTSFRDPAATVHSIVTGTLHLLEAIRAGGAPMRFCNAGSGEVFGVLEQGPATEASPLRPASPYAAAKAAAQLLTRSYRDSFGLFAATAILFNHESPLRGDQFVTRKIVAAAARIAGGSRETLTLGNLDVARDWGWAPDYVEGMSRLLQHDTPVDVILATGRVTLLRDFVDQAFRTYGLDWRDHVERSEALVRAGEPMWSSGDPSLAGELLGWRATHHMPNIVRMLCEAEAPDLVRQPHPATA